MRLQNCAFAASAIAVICCSCLVAAAKREFRSECINGQVVESSALRGIVTPLLVAASLALGASAACVVKPLCSRGKTVAAAVCSKWQPLYFIVISFQKIILRAIVIAYDVRSRSTRVVVCHLHADDANQLHAAMFLWNCAILMSGLLTICIDVDTEFSSAVRRCVQFVLAMCLCLDAVGSYIWGNEMASLASLSVSRFEFLFDNMITSCITSQVVIAFHFMFVGWRSRHGRGWYYFSLRFELDACGRSFFSQLKRPHTTQKLKELLVSSPSTTDGETSPDMFRSKPAVTSRSNLLSHARHRLFQFQQRHVSRCRVFVIPCVAVPDPAPHGRADIALARPIFDLRFLRPLQRFAQAHPKFHFSFSFFFLVLPSIACSIFVAPDIRGIPTLFLNFAYFVALLAFLSSKRYNLDRVAVRQLVLSFRFGIFIVLLSQWIFLETRRAYLRYHEGQVSLYVSTPWSVAAICVAVLFFVLCLLLDCSPHLPATSQIILTVSACSFSSRTLAPFTVLADRMVHYFRVLGLP